MILFICDIYNDQTREQTVVAKGWGGVEGRGNGELLLPGYKVSAGQDK